MGVVKGSCFSHLVGDKGVKGKPGPPGLGSIGRPGPPGLPGMPGTKVRLVKWREGTCQLSLCLFKKTI